MDKLFAHQETAINRYTYKDVIPLFFEPGTGKTRTSLEIALRKYQHGQIDTLLIVAPKGIDEQWVKQEIPRWYSGNTDYNVVFRLSKEKMIPFREGLLNIIVTNIDVFSTQSAYIRFTQFCNAHKTMIILDEATRIKNPTSKRTQRMLYEFNTVVRKGKQILSSEPRTVARCILTGTPVTNSILDLWSLFEFLSPTYFGVNYYAFKNRYGLFTAIDVNGRSIQVPMKEEIFNAIVGMDELTASYQFGVNMSTIQYIKEHPEWHGPYKHIDEVIDRVNDTAMFVHIKDVIDMPSQFYTVKHITMSDEQRKAYDSMKKDYLVQYGDEVVTATTKMVAMIRLQQIASGFIPIEDSTDEMVEDGRDADSIIDDLFGIGGDVDSYDVKKAVWFNSVPKLDQLKADIEELNPQPVIILTRFSAEAEKIFDLLVEEGYRVALLTGWKRVGNVADLGTKYDIVVANIRCISMGYNLQVAHHMIFYSNSYSAEDRVQVEARIWRAGQKETCIYIDYVSEGTKEEDVLNALKMKRSIAAYIGQASLREVIQ